MYDDSRNSSYQMDQMLILQERTRIARNIHDSLGHLLTNSLIGIDTAVHLLDKDPLKAKQYLKMIKGTLQQGLNDMREMIYTMQDDKTSFIELLPTIRLLLYETERNTGVRIIEDFPAESLKLNSASEMAIFRMIQEGLTNGIRHGKSTFFQCIMAIDDSSVGVLLEDNGVGFCINQSFEGFGLRSMRERIEEVGGQLTVLSEKNEGTRLIAVIPKNFKMEEGEV